MMMRRRRRRRRTRTRTRKTRSHKRHKKERLDEQDHGSSRALYISVHSSLFSTTTRNLQS